MPKAVVVGTVIAALLWTAATPVGACSCAAGDPRGALGAADAAALVVVRAMLESKSDDPRYSLSIERTFKGSLGKTVAVRSSDTCGLELEVGQRIGLLLHSVGGGWEAGLCDQMRPERLEAASRPLEPSKSAGPVAFMAAGEIGKFRTIAIDGEARVVSVGRGGGSVGTIKVCPGDHTSVEGVANGSGPPAVVVRDIASQRIKRRISLREFREKNGWRYEIGSVSCSDPDAKEAWALVRPVLAPTGPDEDSHPPPGRLLAIAAGSRSEVWAGRASDATYHSALGYAFVASDDPPAVLIRRSAREPFAELASLPRRASTLAVSPDGAYVAVFMGAFEAHRSELWVISTADGGVATSSPEGGDVARALLWPGTAVVTVATIGKSAGDVFESFSPDGSLLGRWRGWPGFALAAADSQVFGVDPTGEVFAADAISGNPRSLGTLGVEGVVSLVRARAVRGLSPPSSGDARTSLWALGAVAVAVVSISSTWFIRRRRHHELARDVKATHAG